MSSRPPVVPSLSIRGQVWFLAAAAILLLLCGSSNLPLIDRDEPRFAEATREMMQRHDWLVPTFNGAYRFDKPPLTYWAMAVFYKLGGTNELTARLHSIVSTLALALVVYAAGSRWFSPLTGFGAAFGLLTSLQILLHGRLSVADMPMVLAMAVAQVALFEILSESELEEQANRKARRRWRWTLYLALAAGFLAKGPVALAVPLLTALLYRFAFWRKPQPWGRLKLHWGLLLVLALVGAWGIPGLIETHGLWWKVGMGEHVVDRGMEALNSRHYFAPYYLATAFLSYFPWIAFLGYGVVALRRNWNERNAFLLSWLAAPYLIFLAYATQLPHYILPAFPAFFLILAQGLSLRSPLPRWPRGLAWGVLAVYALLPLALLAVLAVVPAALAPLRLALLGIAAVLGGLVLLGVLFLTDRLGAARWPVVVIALGFLVAAAGLRPLLPALKVAELAQGMPPGTRYAAYGFTEGSLVFYTGTLWKMDPAPSALDDLVRPGPRVVVQLKSEVKIGDALKWAGQRLGGGHPALKVSPHPYAPDADAVEVSGLNFARASWETIAVTVEKR